ncbi:MAG: HAMP domain-containing protein [Nanoarchaeota archaeon]|nr:HAMP domain-containing protein [Nanoarchaeota archaeon]
MNFKNLPIGIKILLGFFLIILLYGIITLINYYDISEVRDLASEVVPRVDQMSHLQDIAVALESFEKNIDKYLSIGYVEYGDKAKQDLLNTIEFIENSKNNTDDTLLPELKEFEVIISEMQDTVVFLTHTDRANHKLVNEKIVLVYTQLNNAKQRYNELISKTTSYTKEIVVKQKIIINRVINLFLVLGLSILIIGIVLSLFLSKTISKPITKLRNASNEIGKGNLDAKIEVNSGDEIGDLAKTFNEMRVQLKQREDQAVKDREELLNSLLSAFKGKLGNIATILARKNVKELVEKNPRIIKILPPSLAKSIKKERELNQEFEEK